MSVQIVFKNMHMQSEIVPLFAAAGVLSASALFVYGALRLKAMQKEIEDLQLQQAICKQKMKKQKEAVCKMLQEYSELFSLITTQLNENSTRFSVFQHVNPMPSGVTHDGS